MSAVFLELFNRAVSAGWLLLALLILRPVLKKLPAWVRCLLWGLAAVRLVLPIRFESAWSLVPSAETLSQNTVRYDAVPQLTSGIEALNSAVNERLMEPYFRADAAVSMNPLHVWTEIAGIVWLTAARRCSSTRSCGWYRQSGACARPRFSETMCGCAMRSPRRSFWACFARGSICPRGWTARRGTMSSRTSGRILRGATTGGSRWAICCWRSTGSSRFAGSPTGASAGIWSWPATSGPCGSWASRSGRRIRPRCSRAQRRDGRCWPARWHSAK